MAMTVHFSSASCEWETPQDLFDALNVLWGPFDIDVCATKQNAKCKRFYTKNQDGLVRPWKGRIWMNPPYGREIGKWMRKAWISATHGNASVVVCLVPARTDTAWWHEYAMKGKIEFIRGRIKFNGHKNSAPFPSAVVVFGAKEKA